MNYIILDLEWNQGDAASDTVVPEVPFEIVEIGAIKLSEDRQMTGEFSQLIKPQIYHGMHKITGRLIHLQMEQLEQGIPFPEVYENFKNWCGEDAIFCTWGPTDLTEFQRNMEYYGLPPMTDRPLRYYDVQKLFSIAFEDKKSRRSLEHAVDALQLKKDIPFHRAFSDAYYTAKIFEKIQDEEVLTNFSYDTHVKPRTRNEEIRVVFANYAKYISRVFENKQEAMKDKEVTSCRCYICRKNIRRKMKWYSLNGKHYYALSYCPKHGYMKGKIRIRKAEDECCYVVKTERFVTPEEADELIKRRKMHRKTVYR